MGREVYVIEWDEDRDGDWDVHEVALYGGRADAEKLAAFRRGRHPNCDWRVVRYVPAKERPGEMDYDLTEEERKF